jgi:hypothetical protein
MTVDQTPSPATSSNPTEGGRRYDAVEGRAELVQIWRMRMEATVRPGGAAATGWHKYSFSRTVLRTTSSRACSRSAVRSDLPVRGRWQERPCAAGAAQVRVVTRPVTAAANPCPCSRRCRRPSTPPPRWCWSRAGSSCRFAAVDCWMDTRAVRWLRKGRLWVLCHEMVQPVPELLLGRREDSRMGIPTGRKSHPCFGPYYPRIPGEGREIPSMSPMRCHSRFSLISACRLHGTGMVHTWDVADVGADRGVDLLHTLQ